MAMNLQDMMKIQQQQQQMQMQQPAQQQMSPWGQMPMMGQQDDPMMMGPNGMQSGVMGSGGMGKMPPQYGPKY